jgi:hypothetical protein
MWLEFSACNGFVDGIHLSFSTFQISICIRKKQEYISLLYVYRLYGYSVAWYVDIHM